MTTYSPPIELRPVCSSDKSPRIDNKPISFGDVSPSTPFMQLPPEQCSTFSNSSPNNQQPLTSSLSISSDKLISLDTPQQTPTTMNPPLLFDDLSAAHKATPKTINDHHQQQQNQHQFIDGNGNGNNGHIDKTSANNNHHSSSTSNGKIIYLIRSLKTANCMDSFLIAGPINPITLDPSTLESYANVQMTNAQHDAPLTSNTTNVTGNNNDIEKMNPPPFTIQGYSERYNAAKENHSEISC